MVPLRLAWTLLAVSAWTFGSSQFLLHEPVKVLYPAVLGNETIECDCRNISCNVIFWFYTDPANAEVRYIGRCNNAERTVFGDVSAKDTDRFKLTKRGSSTFVLRIVKVTRKDAGIYSCVVRDTRSQAEMYNPGTSLRPGETPPTPPPPKKTSPGPRFCPCPWKIHPRDDPADCHPLVLWPLVGLVAGLAAGLLCSLYYFSRLPKKCRHHHFVKKRLT